MADTIAGWKARAEAAEHKAFMSYQREQAAENKHARLTLDFAVYRLGPDRGMVKGGGKDVARQLADTLAPALWGSDLHVGDALETLRDTRHYLFTGAESWTAKPVAGRTTVEWAAIPAPRRLELINEHQAKGKN